MEYLCIEGIHQEFVNGVGGIRMKEKSIVLVEWEQQRLTLVVTVVHISTREWIIEWVTGGHSNVKGGIRLVQKFT